MRCAPTPDVMGVLAAVALSTVAQGPVLKKNTL
jgi:hypothetical protein